MTTRDPEKRPSGKSELLAFFRWLLSNWPRVLRAVVLISAPIVGVLIFLGIAVTVIFYLKVDPQRWGAVLGLGVIVISVAKVVFATRNWWAGRKASPPEELPPPGQQDVSGADGDTGADGDGDGDTDVRD